MLFDIRLHHATDAILVHQGHSTISKAPPKVHSTITATAFCRIMPVLVHWHVVVSSHNVKRMISSVKLSHCTKSATNNANQILWETCPLLLGIFCNTSLLFSKCCLGSLILYVSTNMLSLWVLARYNLAFISSAGEVAAWRIQGRDHSSQCSVPPKEDPVQLQCM